MSPNGAITTASKPLPAGVVAKPPAEYHRPLKGLPVHPLGYRRSLCARGRLRARLAGRLQPEGGLGEPRRIATASVGVGRDLSPDTGTGGELYAVIGHAPRHLDRNIAVVGRVIEGIERTELAAARHRGARLLQGAQARTCRSPSVRLASQTAARPSGRRSNIWTRRARASPIICGCAPTARTTFYIRPAGGVDLCNAAGPGAADARAVARLRYAAQAWASRFLCWMITGAVVRAHAGLGQRQGRRAEGAFGGHPADQPVGPAAAGAMVDLMLAVDRVIAPPGGLERLRSVRSWPSSHYLPFAVGQRAKRRPVAPIRARGFRVSSNQAR